MKKPIMSIIMAAIFSAANIFAAESNAKKLSNDTSLQFGFCRPNLMWVGDQNKALKLLDGIKASGAKCVQLTMRENAEPTFRHIEYANSIGLPVNMLIMPMEDFMRNGSKPRPKTKHFWSVYGLSQLDAKKFEKKLDKLLDTIAKRRLNILSIELFNEINWVDFNGDLQPVEGGAIIDESNYKNFPFMKNYIAGMEKYTQLVSILRKKIDDKYSNGKTGLPKPLIVCGSPVLGGDSNWLNKVGGSVIDLNFHYKILAGKFEGATKAENVFDKVDAVAAHIYPGAENIDNNPETCAATAEKTVRAYIDPVFEFAPRDILIFITEFSFSSWLFRNEPDPQAARALTTKNFLMQFSKTTLKDVNWGCIFHYCYDDDDNWGAISKDGKIRQPMLDIFKESYPKNFAKQPQ